MYSYEVIKDNGLIGYKNILVEIQIIVGVSDAGVFKVRLNTAHFNFRAVRFREPLGQIATKWKQSWCFLD